MSADNGRQTATQSIDQVAAGTWEPDPGRLSAPTVLQPACKQSNCSLTYGRKAIAAFKLPGRKVPRFTPAGRLVETINLPALFTTCRGSPQITPTEWNSNMTRSGNVFYVLNKVKTAKYYDYKGSYPRAFFTVVMYTNVINS